MKTNLLVLISMLMIFHSRVYSQTTISIKLDAIGEDATIDDFSPTQNNPSEIEYFSGSWTIGGTAVIWRNLFRFDLSQLPANAVIQSAYMNLYFAPLNNFGANDTSLTNSNQSVLQRIDGAWNENSVTWINQPATVSQNQVILQQSTSAFQDYLMVDVTALTQDIYAAPVNYGFMLKLINETPYARLIFASGDYPDPALHPELIITYTLCSTLVLNDDGEDATIDTYGPSNNYPNEIELDVEAWTIGGTAVTWRSLLKFDLSQIPSNAFLTSANLSLFYADTNNFGNALHSSLTSSNESVIMRVVDPWSENQVTWNNQPSATSQNQVILNQSVTGTDDYTGLDVLSMVQDMLASTNGNQGFMIRLTNETPYAQMIFASGDNPHINKHPLLEICYSIPTSVSNLPGDQFPSNIYPNPSMGTFSVIAENISSIFIFDIAGKMVYSKKTGNQENAFKIELDDVAPGIYFIKLSNEKKSITRKIIIESAE